MSTRLNFVSKTSKCNCAVLISTDLLYCNYTPADFPCKRQLLFFTWQHCIITTTLSYFLVPCPRRLALWEKMKNLVPLCHWLMDPGNWYWLLAPCSWQLALTGYWLKEFASGFLATGYWLWHLAPGSLSTGKKLLAPSSSWLPSY